MKLILINIVSYSYLISSLLLDDVDSFGLLVFTVGGLVIAEIIYTRLTGHHSYIFTKLIYDPSHVTWKSNVPSGTSYSSFEFSLVPLEGIAICVILLLIIFFIIRFNRIINLFRILNKKTIIIVMIFISPVILLSTLSYFFPFFGFILMTFGLILFLPLTFPFKISTSFTKFRTEILDHLLTFLYHIKFIAYASTFSIIVFCQPKKLFRNYVFLGALFTLIYAIVSRWYFFNTVVMHQNFSGLTYYMVFVLLFVGIFFIYLRLIISLSFLVLNTTFLRRPELLPNNVVYVLTGEENPFDHPTTQHQAQYPKPNSPRPINFLNFDKSRHYYRAYMENVPHNGKIFRYVGIGVGTLGVSAAVYAAYHTGLQTGELRKQSFEMTRQNDLAEVEQGLMSKERYSQKYSQESQAK
jgi:hypothetical protein